MKKVVWGVLGTAKISWEKVIPALRKSELCEVRAVGSRSAERSQAFAKKMNIPVAYGSYDELLADPQIEVVYNPLPNDLHIPLTLQAARAGKHVLCEKPVALTADEAAALREVADRVHIMEGFMVRFHPQWVQLRERVRAGELGELRAIQCFFSFFNRDAHNIRNRVDSGGGAAYDIGVYPVVIGRFIYGCEPVRVVSLVDRDPDFGVDRMVSALVDFGNGRRLDFTVSTQTVAYQRVQLVGTAKRIEVQIPFNAPLGGSTQLLVDATGRVGDATVQTETVPACDMYTLQCDAFSRAVRGLEPLPFGVEDAIANMRVIDALFASERTLQWSPV